jgi:type IV fimbrial biogenesis protein FimT
MIGLVISAILLTMGITNFRSWLQNAQIRTASEAIQNGLQLARVEAVRRNAPVQFTLGTASGWTVGCVTATAACPATIQSRSAGEGSTNAAVAADQDIIAFNGLGRVTPVPAGNINIDITNPTGGTCATAGPMRCMRVVVSPGGQVRMCDPARASSDPMGC